MKREELLAIAKPILFNTEMVRAILEDRKIVTRRVIKVDLNWADTDENDSSYLFFEDKYGDSYHAKYFCRYQVGDILYVRETYQRLYSHIALDFSDNTYAYIYKASHNGEDWEQGSQNWAWKPSIHMPKEAARIFLKVTGVRVERLNDITSKEAIKEGLKDKYAYGEYNSMEPKKLFIDLWNTTINKQDLDTYGWEANPYVWVIEFERIEVEV